MNIFTGWSQTLCLSELPQKTQNSPVQSSPRLCIASLPVLLRTVCCASWPLMYTLIVLNNYLPKAKWIVGNSPSVGAIPHYSRSLIVLVYTTREHSKNKQANPFCRAIFVVYGEWGNLVIFSAWPLLLWTSLLYRQPSMVFASSDKCTDCKSLWIKPSD